MMHEAEHAHHHHTPTAKYIGLSFGVTAVVFVAELGGGYFTHSLALLSDAWHVLTDLLALGLTWLAFRQAARPATESNTYGFHRFEVLAALFNGVSLLVITGGIFYEAAGRLLHPNEVLGLDMLVIAFIGLMANLLVALLLGHSHDESLNVRSAMLHVIGDALSSVAVIVGGVLIAWRGWYWADPVISILIGLMILRGAYRLTREALHILMEGRPRGLAVAQVMARLRQVTGVMDVHDLHVWNVSSQIRAASLHVLVDETVDQQEVLDQCRLILQHEFGIAHSVVQVERSCDQHGTDRCDMRPGAD